MTMRRWSGVFAVVTALIGTAVFEPDGWRVEASVDPSGVAGAEAPSGLAQVFLADGTSVALSGWALSYEYQAVPPGASRGLVQPSRREARELWLGKDSWPLVGRTLAIRYKTVEVERLGAEGLDRGQAQAAESLALTAADGKTKSLRLEQPSLDRLRGAGPKVNVIFPLGLDLRGTSLAGTQRQFCLASFDAFGVCQPADGDRVVRIIFQG
jgi:hypothetical protein